MEIVKEDNNAMRRMAFQTWGKVIKKIKIEEGFAIYKCENGIGFVADTNIIEDLKGTEKVLKVKSGTVSFNVLDSEQHYTSFDLEGSIKYLRGKSKKLIDDIFWSINKEIVGNKDYESLKEEQLNIEW